MVLRGRPRGRAGHRRNILLRVATPRAGLATLKFFLQSHRRSGQWPKRTTSRGAARAPDADVAVAVSAEDTVPAAGPAGIAAGTTAAGPAGIAADTTAAGPAGIAADTTAGTGMTVPAATVVLRRASARGTVARREATIGDMTVTGAGNTAGRDPGLLQVPFAAPRVTAPETGAKVRSVGTAERPAADAMAQTAAALPGPAEAGGIAADTQGAATAAGSRATRAEGTADTIGAQGDRTKGARAATGGTGRTAMAAHTIGTTGRTAAMRGAMTGHAMDTGVTGTTGGRATGAPGTRRGGDPISATAPAGAEQPGLAVRPGSMTGRDPVTVPGLKTVSGPVTGRDPVTGRARGRTGETARGGTGPARAGAAVRTMTGGQVASATPPGTPEGLVVNGPGTAASAASGGGARGGCRRPTAPVCPTVSLKTRCHAR